MKPRPLITAVLLLALELASPVARAADPDPWFGRDKALHFGASAAIAIGGYGASALVLDDYAPRAATGAGLALTAGVGKELFDLAGYGDPSWRDLTWDVAGTLAGIGLSLAIDAAIRGAAPLPAR